MPGRNSIRPADIPRLLPHVSLIEIERSPLRFRFRLAGTRLRDLYDREVTGLYLDEVDWGGQSEYWRAAHHRVAETGRPAQGVVRGLRAVKDHLVHFWLRLPLSTERAQPGIILGYDVSVPVSDMSGAVKAVAGISTAAAAG